METFFARSRYLGYGWVITSHSLLWDVITYTCPRQLLMAPKSSYKVNQHKWKNIKKFIFKLPFGHPVTGYLVAPMQFPFAQGNLTHGVVKSCNSVYSIRYAFGFVLLCFVGALFLVHSWDLFTNILQGCRLQHCYWNNRIPKPHTVK